MSKDALPTQSTTLEALLRGEGLDKRSNSKNDEESLLEIQVGAGHVNVGQCHLHGPGPRRRGRGIEPGLVAKATGQVFPADLQGSLVNCRLAANQEAPASDPFTDRYMGGTSTSECKGAERFSFCAFVRSVFIS